MSHITTETCPPSGVLARDKTAINDPLAPSAVSCLFSFTFFDSVRFIDLQDCRDDYYIPRKEVQHSSGPQPAHVCAAYHLPTCAPPSTCSTSPVTWPASVR